MAHVSNFARQGDCTMGWLAEREQRSDRGSSRSAYWSEAVSELLEDRGYRRALQDGFDPDALEVWGIDEYPTKRPAPAHACVFCWADMKNDVAASYRHQACSACIQALKDGRMPARLLPNGTFQIGRAYLAEVCSDAQVDAVLRYRDSVPARRRKPLSDEPIFGLGKTQKGGLVNVDELPVVPSPITGDGAEGGNVVDLEVSEGPDLDTDDAFVEGSQLDCAGCHVGRDFAGEVRHDSSSSVGGGAAGAALVGCASEPTEEAPAPAEIDGVLSTVIAEMEQMLAPLLSKLRGGLTPVIEAAAEAAAARLRRESRVRAERERERELCMRREQLWAAWTATSPRLFLLDLAREHATDTKTWPDGAQRMAMCIERLRDAVRGEREDLWRELLESRRELEALRGAAGGVS